MKKLIIDRTTWLRGEGDMTSYLLRESDGKMCCLGSYALQLAGKKPEDILKHKEPSQCAVGDEWGRLVEHKKRTQPDDTYPECTLTAQELMQFNDDPSLNPKDREKIISDYFRAIGVEVEFIN